MSNVGRLLKAPSQKVLKQHKGTPPTKIPQLATAETRRIAHCRANVKSIVYQANVLSEDGASYSYIDLTDNAFEKRWSNHCQSFKNEA